MNARGSLVLSTRIVHNLLRLASFVPGREICGFLMAPPGQPFVYEILPVQNVAKNPEIEYEMNPVLVRSIWLSRKAEIAGTFHSHPDGPALCSSRDRALVRSTKLDMAIVSPSTKEIRIYGVFDGENAVMELQQYRLT